MDYKNAFHLFQTLLEEGDENLDQRLLNFITSDHNFFNETTKLIASYQANKKETLVNVLINGQAENLVDDSQVHELLNTQVAQYKLIKKLGQGGMGVVYLGERNDGQLQQKVAIKFIFPSIAALAGENFLQKEAQHLANLDHANIAHIYTVGTTSTNLPYMVMEYVEGVAIDEYCENKSLDLKSRLTLFKKLCDAVHFAHQNMVIHADIKPSNILVSELGELKLMDFGIARSINQIIDSEEENLELRKQYLQAISQNYASPEQIVGDQLTSACDTYSLGKVLNGLLSNSLLSAIQEKELHSIIRECMQDEAYLRLSVMQLNSYLDDLNNKQSIDIYSKSFFYQFKKFISRNKALAFVSTSALVLALVFVGNIIQSNKELKQKSLVVSESLEFLEGSLMQFGVNDLNHQTVQELIGKRVTEIGKLDSKEVQANLGYIFGRISSSIDELDTATKLLRNSASYFGKVKEYKRQISSLNSLSIIYTKKGDSEKGIEISKEALKIATDNDVFTEIPVLLNNIGSAYFSINDYQNAYKYFSRSVKNIDKTEQKADYHGSIAMSYQNLASAAGQIDKKEEAEKYFKLAQQTLLKSSDQNLAQKTELDAQLGFFYIHQDKFELARDNLDKALLSTLEIYGNDHTNVAFKSYNLAKAYLGLKQYEKAQPLIEQAVRIFLSKFGEEDYRLALVRQGLAECLYNQGKHTIALPIIDKSLTVLNDFFGVEHIRTKKAQSTKDEITNALSKG